MAIQKLTVGIDGMHCDECATGLKQVAECVEGVRDVAINFHTKTLASEFDDNHVSAESIIKEIESIGYRVVLA